MTTITKITTSFNKEDDSVNIYLKSGNTTILKLDGYEVQLPPFSKSKAKNKNIYLQYAKEYVINLIKNCGISGIEYNEEIEEIKKSQSIIFDNNKTFTVYFVDKLKDIFNEFGYDIDPVISIPNTTKRNKNGSMSYSDAKATILLGGQAIEIGLEVKSGQPCKPKTMKYNEMVYSINATNINKIGGGGHGKGKDI